MRFVLLPARRRRRPLEDRDDLFEQPSDCGASRLNVKRSKLPRPKNDDALPAEMGVAAGKGAPSSGEKIVFENYSVGGGGTAASEPPPGPAPCLPP